MGFWDCYTVAWNIDGVDAMCREEMGCQAVAGPACAARGVSAGATTLRVPIWHIR